MPGACTARVQAGPSSKLPDGGHPAGLLLAALCFPWDITPNTPEADARCCDAAGQGAPVYYQTRRPTEAHVGSTICLDKTYLLDTGARRPCP